jgi:hypothetical protein
MTSSNRMAGYSYPNHLHHNQAYDAMSDRNSQIFWDALSMASGSDRNSIAMSVYHSVPELHYNENATGHNDTENKVNEMEIFNCCSHLSYKLAYNYTFVQLYIY